MQISKYNIEIGPDLCGDIHDVPNPGGLCKSQAVQCAGQQVPTAPYAAGRNVRALLHPPHDLTTNRPSCQSWTYQSEGAIL